MKNTLRIVAIALVAVMLCMALVSCGSKPNSDPAKAVEGLKDEGYTAEKIDSAIGLAMFSWAGKNIEAVVTGMKLADKEAVTVIYYKEASDAKDAFEAVEKYMDEAEDDDEVKDYVVKQSGKMIFAGTKAAIKAAA